MSLFSKLFGGGNSSGQKQSEAEAITHGEYRIFARPSKEAGGYRVGARIEKEIDGDVKIHDLVRADTIASLEEATDTSVNKAKQVIDQLGDQIFR